MRFHFHMNMKKLDNNVLHGKARFQKYFSDVPTPRTTFAIAQSFLIMAGLHNIVNK